MDVPLLAWVCYGAAIWLHEVEMTNDQIIELAKQAGLLPNHEVYEEDLQRFAELVRNAALDEAATACESEWITSPEKTYGSELAEYLRSLKS